MCEEMGRAGAYMTNVIGMCQREIRAVRAGQKSRIDRFLAESATYAAAKRREDLGSRFDPARATAGFLLWTDDLKTGKMHPPFPVSVDAVAGIVRQEDAPFFGLLADVRDCLVFRDREGTLVSWGASGPSEIGTWLKPTNEEITISSSLTSTVGTMTSGRRRVGQDWFRLRLIKLWDGKCAVTGCSHPRLLRASHIVAWSGATTAERLDQHNGLLLAAHLDAAFEVGLVTFADDGRILLSPHFSGSDRAAIGVTGSESLRHVPEGCKAYLARHRQRHGFG